MKPNPTLTKYASLTGEWQTEVSNAEWLEPGEILKGVAKFEWFENKSFITMHSESFPEEGKPGPPKAVAVISCDDTSGQCQMLYYDERGVSRIYETSFENGILKHWRDVPDFPQRFEGKVSEDEKSIEAVWWNAKDGGEWGKDFDIRYFRKK
jgi:hypothetical protein